MYKALKVRKEGISNYAHSYKWSSGPSVELHCPVINHLFLNNDVSVILIMLFITWLCIGVKKFCFEINVERSVWNFLPQILMTIENTSCTWAECILRLICRRSKRSSRCCTWQSGSCVCSPAHSLGPRFFGCGTCSSAKVSGPSSCT